MKRILRLIIIILPIALGTFYVKIYRIDVVQDIWDNNVTFPHGEIVEQVFEAKHNNLSRIVLGTFNQNINRPAEMHESFTINIINKAIPKIERTLQVSSMNFTNGGTFTLSFDPIQNSKGVLYAIEIISEASKGAMIPEVAAGYSKLELFQNHFWLSSSSDPTIRGNLAFQTLYKDKVIFILRDSVSDFISHVFQDKIFLTFYLLLVSVFIVIIKNIR